MNFTTGDKVRYHPIIGGRHDDRIYTVTHVGDLYGRPVAWLEGKAGCVAIAALSVPSPGLIDPQGQPFLEATQ